MKNEKLMRAIGQIDEDLIMEARQVVRPRRVYAKWTALAASLAIVVAGTAIAMPHLTTGTEPELSGSTPTENVIVT